MSSRFILIQSKRIWKPSIWRETATEQTYRYQGAPPLLELCASAQRYYEDNFYTTEVLPASLTSVYEVMALAGAHHITIAPPLLLELSSIEALGYKSKIPNVFDASKDRQDEPPALMSFADDEAAFRAALRKNDNGKNEVKMTQVLLSKYFPQHIFLVLEAAIFPILISLSFHRRYLYFVICKKNLKRW